MAESEVREVGPTVFGGCWVGTKIGWTTVFGGGGGRLVSGVALSVAFGTVFGSVGGNGLESLGSGGSVAFGTVCGAVGDNGLESL